MAKIYQYDMKVPFDMSDVNGFIKMPQLILLSLQVSGMQSMELGISDEGPARAAQFSLGSSPTMTSRFIAYRFLMN